VTGSGVGVISGLKQFSPSLKHDGKGSVVQGRHSFTAERCAMLTLLNLAAVLTMQTPPAPPPPPHMRTETRVMVMGDHDGPGGLDKDGDGQLTREEFTGPMNDAFARMDTDGNGRLSHEELRAGHGPGGPGGEHEMMIFREGPGGGDGPMRHRMERHRTGPDGGPGERVEERIMVITDGAPGEDDDERNVFVHRSGPDGGPMMWNEAEGGTRIEIERTGGDDLDSDGDGKISEAEFLAPMRAAFARMDADHSGAIEAGERGGDRQVRVITRHREGPAGE
tara:strand:- start:29627 stop:30463 length:837 start_codon:yes stop_codon:yes gene_type:complete